MALSYHASRELQAFAFASDALFKIILATQVNSLARYSERTSHTAAWPTIIIRFQALLTLCQEFFSAFPHGTIRYRTQLMFKVGSYCLPNSGLISSRPYSRYCQILLFRIYGTITLYGLSFQTSLTRYNEDRKAANTTSLQLFSCRFSLPYAAFTRRY
jgi:hypothetical protein